MKGKLPMAAIDVFEIDEAHRSRLIAQPVET